MISETEIQEDLKMLNTVHMDAQALLDGGWKPDDYEEIKEEYGLTEDETCEICQEMERILNVGDDGDEADRRYHEAMENGMWYLLADSEIADVICVVI